MAYATVEQLLNRLPDFDLDDQAALAAARGLLEEASAYLDGEIRRPSDPFDMEVFHVVTDEDVATARTFFGSGTNFLLLDPYVGVLADDAVSTPGSAAYLPSYWTEAAGGIYVSDVNGTVYACGSWRRGQPYVVSARWGYTAVPGDVQTAVLDWAAAAYIRSYVENDRDKLPAETRGMSRCIERWRMRRAMEAAL